MPRLVTHPLDAMSAVIESEGPWPSPSPRSSATFSAVGRRQV